MVNFATDSAIKLITFPWIGGEMIAQFVGDRFPFLGIIRRWLLGRNIWPNFREIGIQRYEFFQSRLGVGFDGLDRALGLANPTVDTLIRMYHEHILSLVETIHGADLHAIHVFAFDAGIDDDVSH